MPEAAASGARERAERAMRTLLAVLAMATVAGFAAPALAQSDKGGPVKVVYHLSDGNAQAT